MRIAGRWHKCDDDVVRPILLIRVRATDGATVDERFLIDTGADRTVFSTTLFKYIGGALAPAPAGISLAGIGGSQGFVEVQAVLELVRDDGSIATVNGNFAAFTDPTATDFSILGRDVLYHFDLILSRSRDEVLLLTGSHRYQVIAL